MNSNFTSTLLRPVRHVPKGHNGRTCLMIALVRTLVICHI